jgi:hypothetical protein
MVSITDSAGAAVMVEEAVIAVAVVVEVGAKDITALPPTLTSATPAPAPAPTLTSATPASAHVARLPAPAVAVAVVPFRRLAADKNDGIIAEDVVETAFVAAVEPDVTVDKDAAAAADAEEPIKRPVTKEREGDA